MLNKAGSKKYKMIVNIRMNNTNVDIVDDETGVNTSDWSSDILLMPVDEVKGAPLSKRLGA